MRRLAFLLIGLAFTATAPAADIPDKPVLVLDPDGHTAMVKQVLFTPDGKELISVSDDKTIRVWDVQSGEPVRVLRPPIGRGPEGKLYAAALAPDGRTLAVGGYGWTGNQIPIYLIALATGQIERVLVGHANAINALAFAADGRRLASAGGDHTARVWDVATGKCERVLEGHAKPVYGIAFSPDGTQVATASYDTTGRIWDVATGHSAAVLKGHKNELQCVAWSPDGRLIATGGYDRSIRFWRADGAALQSVEGLESYVMSLTFTADSRGLLFTWGGESGNRVGAALLDPSTRRERMRFIRHNNTVRCGAVSPDGTLAATAGGNDYEIHLWKTADGASVHRLASKGRAAWSAAWSPDGTAIAWGNTNQAGGLNADAPLEHAFRLAELAFAPAPDASYRRAQRTRGALALASTGKTTVAVRQGDQTVATLAMSDPYESIRCFTLLPGDRAAVGTVYGLYLFDTRSGKQVRDFLGHTSEVWAVAPSPDGRLLLSASNDQTLCVWDLDRDEPLVSLFFAGNEWIAWTPEGYYAASPGGEKLMGWHLNHGKDQMATFYRASQFRKSLYRPDVVKLLPTTLSTDRALEVADMAKGGKPTERVEVAEVLPPLVEIATPRSGTRISVPQLEVKAIARSRGEQPVMALRLLLDGRPYRGQGGIATIAAPRPGEVRQAWTVTLEPGEHSITVQAESAVSQAVSLPVAVTYQSEEPADVRPNLYVLAIGISAYPGDLRLNYAAHDAEAISEVFRTKSAALFHKVEERRLTDAGATRQAILTGLTWLRKQMTQRDIAVVFYSGHGLRDAEGSLFLLPVDGDPDDLLASSVSDDQVKKALAGLPGRVIALLDACHAGAVGGDRRKGIGGLTDDLVRDLVTDDYGVIVMASSMGREESQENNAHRGGAFTVALTEGLTGKADINKDGVVYWNELDAYITDRVKELTRGQQHPVTAKPTSIRSFPLAKP